MGHVIVLVNLQLPARVHHVILGLITIKQPKLVKLPKIVPTQLDLLRHLLLQNAFKVYIVQLELFLLLINQLPKLIGALTA